MEYVIIAIVVLIGAGLTFFSGFGLGTLLLPVFALFFPLPVAVAAQAIVHFANNIFKFGLVYKSIHYPTLLWFGIPAFIAAFGGAMVLETVSGIGEIHSYLVGEKVHSITWLKIVVGCLMIFFAWFDLDPRFSNWNVDKKYLPIGGILSGFFGGLSGHQGAFRAAFLAKSGLDKNQFIATSNAVSLLVDSIRIATYIYIPTKLAQKGGQDLFETLGSEKTLLIVGIVCAFIGTYFGKKLVEKTTIGVIQKVVGVLLIVMGLLLISGII